MRENKKGKRDEEIKIKQEGIGYFVILSFSDNKALLLGD
jgi:hypothetical protein